MEAGDIRSHRKALGLGRKELAETAGVTVGALASVEAGKKSRDKEAVEKIITTLEQLIAPSTRSGEGGDQRPAGYREGNLKKYEEAHPDRTVSYEWNGLELESRFTVIGEEGVFAFVRHVTNENGDEWVDAWGGERNYPAHSRSFRVERIVPM